MGRIAVFFLIMFGWSLLGSAEAAFNPADDDTTEKKEPAFSAEMKPAGTAHPVAMQALDENFDDRFAASGLLVPPAAGDPLEKERKEQLAVIHNDRERAAQEQARLGAIMNKKVAQFKEQAAARRAGKRIGSFFLQALFLIACIGGGLWYVRRQKNEV